MKTRILSVVTITLFLAATGCVEHEELLTVHADGSIDVTMSSESDRAEDLTDGYAVPLAAPWKPSDETTKRWMREVADDTGSIAARDALAARPTSWDGKVRLTARARFASAADLPTTTAPDDEPYATAFLHRTADLRIERRGNRDVYVFERVYHGRQASHPVWTGIVEGIPEELIEAIGAREAITDAQWNTVVRVFQREFGAAARAFARDSLVRVYTHGDASLSTTMHAAIIADVERTVTEALRESAIRELIDATLDYDDAERRGDPVPETYPLVAFEERLREATRASLVRSLERNDIRDEIVNGVLERLEWNFTAREHTEDLGDESFRVVVAMPGTIVGGNFDSLHDGRAVFEFEGQSLVYGDARMTVVSVVEPAR